MMKSHACPPARPRTATHFREAKRPSPPESTSYFFTYFQQSCPTCGRHLRVDVRQLGRQVACSHCRAIFVACDDEVHGRRQAGAPSALERAEQLLARLDAATPTPYCSCQS